MYIKQILTCFIFLSAVCSLFIYCKYPEKLKKKLYSKAQHELHYDVLTIFVTTWYKMKHQCLFLTVYIQGGW